MAIHVHTTKPLSDGATRTSYEPPVSQDSASRTFVVTLEAKDGYAVITDFKRGDRIQLDWDELGDYQLIPAITTATTTVASASSTSASTAAATPVTSLPRCRVLTPAALT